MPISQWAKTLVHSGAKMGKFPRMSEMMKSRVVSRMEERGFNPTTLAVAAGLGKTGVRDMLKRRASVKLDTLEAIARALDCSVAWLIGEASEPEIHMGNGPDLLPAYTGDLHAGVIPVSTESYGSIPRFDARLSAGPGSLLQAEPEPLGYHLVEMDWLRQLTATAPAHLVIVMVDGDSMEPTLRDRDWVLVDTTRRSIADEGVYALCLFEHVKVKRLQPLLSKQLIRVHSDNKLYDPDDVSEEEIHVIGRVISVVSRRV